MSKPPADFTYEGRKKKKDVKAKDSDPPKKGIKRPNTVEITIEVDGQGRYIGRSGDLRYLIMNPEMVSPGQTWKCLVGPPSSSVYWDIYDAMAAEMVSDAPDESDEDFIHEAVPEPGPEPEPEPEPPEQEPAEESDAGKIAQEDVRKIRAELTETYEKLVSANKEIQRLSEENRRIEHLESQLKQKERAEQSLKTQVKQLEKKAISREGVNTVSEMNSYKVRCEQLEGEVERLRQVIEAYDSGSRFTSVTTMLIGETTIHCNYLKGSRYRAYFSPRKRTIRFVPDDEGDARVEDCNVTLPGLASYTKYEKIRQLSARQRGDEIIVTL